MEIHNIIIIGAGPAGLAAAIYTARAGLKPIVIAGPTPGGQLMLTSEVENFPGVKSILGVELMANIRKQAKDFGAKVIDETVNKLELSDKPYKVVLDNKETYETKAIIVATGARAMWLGLESETRLKGKGVSACANCDGFFYKDKIVAVVGGGDAALEEALSLTKFASKVYVIHRRDEFRASKIMQDRVLNHPKIEPVWNAEVEEVLGKEKVYGLRLKNSSNTVKGVTVPDRLDIDGLFVAIGHKPDTEFLTGSGIEMSEQGYIYTSESVLWELNKNPDLNVDKSKFDFSYKYQTSVEGIFAAGDVIDYIYRQATTAMGMGVAAALETEKYISQQG
ncbi:MAG: thioredoxin-disulfide reductase [Candidatus Dojkabacteria bacterium]|nr:thioredoxin-disulfide reductase [Candidatus Dojkabacteria bacterium]